MGYNLRNAWNEDCMPKISNLPTVEAPGIKKSDFVTVLICLQIIKTIVGEQDLAFQQHFLKISSKYSENSNCRKNLIFNARILKLGHFALFYIPFSVSGFFLKL